MGPAIQSEIEALVKSKRVLLFMKGVPAAPQCGFSSAVVGILNGLGVEYDTVDVLSSNDIRQGIKEYTDWPTIPQLYVDGEFVGGADIVQDMNASGELAELLGVEHKAAAKASPNEPRKSPLVADKPVSPPEVTVTPSAVEAITAAAKEEEAGQRLRVEITPLFEHGLFFDEERPGDLTVETAGVKLLFDPQSAVRGRDMSIDFVDNEERTGFKIDNPNKKRLERDATKDEAAQALDAAPMPTAPPEMTITEGAREQFKTAIAEEEAEAGADAKFVIKVGAKRMGATKIEYDLGVIDSNEVSDTDLSFERDGVQYFFDRFSTRNLEGATIDFLTGEDGGASGFKFLNPAIDKGWADPTAEKFQQLIEDEINPSIAAHGGYVELLDIQGDTAFVLMGGGCQGCGMASVTLTQGIQERVKEVIPSIKHLVDSTDHASGSNPYYTAGK